MADIRPLGLFDDYFSDLGGSDLPSLVHGDPVQMRFYPGCRSLLAGEDTTGQESCQFSVSIQLSRTELAATLSGDLWGGLSSPPFQNRRAGKPSSH